MKPANKTLKRIMSTLQTQVTPTQKDEQDIRSFIEDLNIPYKEGGSGPLIFNPAQERVWEKIQECREQKKPIQFIILKARQQGISTLVQAYFYRMLKFYRDRYALVVAHEMEPSKILFKKFQRYHQFDSLAIPTKYNNYRFFEYQAPHCSAFRSIVSDSVAASRGDFFQYIHKSEVAYWRNALEAMIAINQCLPQKTHWDWADIIESTANGTGNLFHDLWEQSEEGNSGYEPIFLSWQSFPKYFLPLEPDEEIKLSEEDKQYKEEFSLADGKMKWMVEQRRTECNNNQQYFDQEYPASPERAFRSTGSPFFNLKVLNQWLNEDTGTTEDPIFEGRLEWEDKNLSKTRHKLQTLVGTYTPHVVWEEVN